MLIKDQIRYSVHRGKLVPSYVYAQNIDVSSIWLDLVIQGIHTHQGLPFSNIRTFLKDLVEFTERDALHFLDGICEVIRLHLIKAVAVDDVAAQRKHTLQMANNLRQQSRSHLEYKQKIEQYFSKPYTEISVNLYADITSFQPLRFCNIPTAKELSALYNGALLLSLLCSSEKFEVFTSSKLVPWWSYKARLWGFRAKMCASKPKHNCDQHDLWRIIIDRRQSENQQNFASDKDCKKRWKGMLTFFMCEDMGAYRGIAKVCPRSSKRYTLEFSSDVKLIYAQSQRQDVYALYPIKLRDFIAQKSSVQISFYTRSEVPFKRDFGVFQVKKEGMLNTLDVDIFYPWQKTEALKILQGLKKQKKSIHHRVYILPKALKQEVMHLYRESSLDPIYLVFYHKNPCSKRTLKTLEELCNTDIS